MKRFFAFKGDNYYPSGGMRDFVGDFDTLDEAVAELTKDYKTLQSWNEQSLWAFVWDSEKRDEAWDHWILPSRTP